jgi:hypothetical protein
MKRISRILLAVMAIGVFQLGAQNARYFPGGGSGGGTGDVIIIG